MQHLSTIMQIVCSCHTNNVHMVALDFENPENAGGFCTPDTVAGVCSLLSDSSLFLS